MDEDLIDELVDRADLNALVRAIDGLCNVRAWDALMLLRNRCHSALKTGRQVWPAATLAEYRLALLAPPTLAVQVLLDRPGRFAVGPLTEVVAQHHTWSELAPLLPTGPEAAYVAHERVLRGEAVNGPTESLGLPFTTQRWEPSYQPVTYHDSSLTADPPVAPGGLATARVQPAEAHDDPNVYGAVRALIEPWLTGSNGTLTFRAVEGTHVHALGAFGLPVVRLTEIDGAAALRWLQWAGASGGAFGRRRGGAAGRLNAWWLLAALAGHDSHDDVDPNELGDSLRQLRWFWWDAFEPVTGWNVSLAIYDPLDDLAWAFRASDHS